MLLCFAPVLSSSQALGINNMAGLIFWPNLYGGLVNREIAEVFPAVSQAEQGQRHSILCILGVTLYVH